EQPDRTGDQRAYPLAAGTGRVAGQRVPGRGVQRGDAGTPDRARAGGLVPVRVVHPLLVPADVHGRAGDRHGVQRVAAGVVDPGGAVRTGTGEVETGRRVAHPAGADEPPGGDDHGVRAVGREVDAAQVRVEVVPAVRRVRGGVPVGRPYRVRGRVGDHELVAPHALGVLEGADGDQAGTVRAHRQVLDLGAAQVRRGQPQVEPRVDGAGRHADPGQRHPGYPAEAGERAADVQL